MQIHEFPQKLKQMHFVGIAECTRILNMSKI
jgi:hypothetical protein